MKKTIAELCLGLVCATGITTGLLADTAPDKSGYNLFHPVPKDQMRELSTDRPDKTETAYSVDAGHFQVEGDIGVLTHDRSGDLESTTWTAGSLNLKLGLVNRADLQVFWEGFVDEHEREESTVSGTRGSGDLSV